MIEEPDSHLGCIRLVAKSRPIACPQRALLSFSPYPVDWGNPAGLCPTCPNPTLVDVPNPNGSTLPVDIMILVLHLGLHYHLWSPRVPLPISQTS
jgi:hypothetical protein